MKRFTRSFFNAYFKILEWLADDSFLGIKKGGIVLIIGFVLAGIIGNTFKNSFVSYKAGYLYFIIVFFIFLLMMPLLNDSTIERISRGKYVNIMDLMKTMNHFSYLYGLIVFSFDISILLEIICVLLQRLIGVSIAILNIKYVIMFSMLVFTMLYFLYHIYIPEEKGHVQTAKKHIQLYSAIGSTISVIMIIVGEEMLFKILLAGILSEYVWLQYFISSEITADNKQS